MKKMLLVGMLSLVATLGLGAAADAYDGNYHHDHHQNNQSHWQNNQYNQMREDSRYVLRRTGVVLQRAQDMARDQRGNGGQWGNQGHHHHGYQNEMGQQRRFRALGMAFAYQNRAIELYQQGNFQLAIDFSLRSRAIALRAIDQMNQNDNWGHDGWNNKRNNDYNDYRDCDMNRGEMDSRESRYWDRRPHGNEMEINWQDSDDDTIVGFHIELNF